MIMRKITLLLPVLLLSLSLLLTGCWDRKELNDLGIMMGLGVDMAGDQIKVTAQVAIPSALGSKTGKSGGTPVTLFHATAPTVFEAIQKLTLSNPRNIFMSHIRVLVFSEKYAAEVGIGDVLEALMRDPGVRPDYYVMIARKAKAETILSTLTSLERIPAEKLYNALEVSAKTWAPTTTVSADRLFEEMLSSGISPVVTGVELRGDKKAAPTESNVTRSDPSAKLYYTGLGVFKKDKLIGWLNESESKGYNYIRDNVKSTVGHLDCKDKGKIALKVLRSTTKMKAKFNEQSEPEIDISLQVVSIIASVECKRRIADLAIIKELEQEAEDSFVELFETTVNDVIKKYKVDIFGFGQEIDRTNHTWWLAHQENWSNYLPKLKVNYKIKYMIKRVGSLDDSFQIDIKE